jgi:5-methylcytosine-specific restriction protein A
VDVMSKTIWQAPGNSKIFDSSFKDPKHVTYRTMKVLQFFYDSKIEYFSSIKEVEVKLVEYLVAEIEDYKVNDSTKSHFYKPLIFYGFLQERKNNNKYCFSLTATGITLLKEFKMGNFDHCINIFFMSLFNVKYPNDATPSCKLYLYPFRILFYLLNQNQGITRNDIVNSMCWINDRNDLENFKTAYNLKINEVANHFWSWVINALCDIGILEKNEDGAYVAAEHIKNEYQNYIEGIEIDDLFIDDKEPYDNYTENKQNILSKYSRDKKNVSLVIEEYGRFCFINKEHESFDNLDNLKYVEVHHIIPFSLSDLLDINLDVKSNLICLCPNCHKKMHYSNYESKMAMIDYIWDRRGGQLSELNFNKLDLLNIYMSNMYLGNKDI